LNLKEKLHKYNRLHTGRNLNFVDDTIILPDGKKASREYVEHPGAVAVLAFVNSKDIVLVRQFRHPVRQVTCEIPAGKIDKGENLTACVKRELLEETGFKASKIKKMISFWPTPAFSTEVLHIYQATGLRPFKMSLDEDEFLKSIIVPFKKALSWVKQGKIRDSKSIIAFLYYLTLNKK
jgi:ADP-ribose pyrophosphatase